jgi:hypothetical protein
MSRNKKVYVILIIVIFSLILIRIMLPFVVLHYANKSLANLKGYYGRIQDVDLAFIRGAYKIDSVYLNKVDSVTKKQTPFFSASVIDLSVEWKSLFKGSLVAEVIFETPVMIFTKNKVEPGTLKKDSADLKQVLDDFMPLQVNRLVINDGIIQYKDEGSKPVVDIAITHAYVLAVNLRNSYDSSNLLPAKITASGDIYGGTLSLNMKLNPLAEFSTFDMNAELKNTNLVALNDFFQAYAKIDVNKGTFGMYTEVATREGKFIGYVKPLIKDLDVLGKEDRDDNIFRKAWEGMVGGITQVFENTSTDKIASKIHFEGDLKRQDTNVGYAIISILRNAFVQALQPAIDNEINIASVPDPDKKNFLQKVFGKKDKEDKRKKKT